MRRGSRDQTTLLSQRSPVIYFLRVWQKRAFRFVALLLRKTCYTLRVSQEKLPYRYTKHSSLLIRHHLTDDPCYMQWQSNKIVNLHIAIKKMNICVIQPGQIFSFWHMVGRPTAKKGFLEGMEISRGKARAGIGGGICQLSNLLNWMAWRNWISITGPRITPRTRGVLGTPKRRNR